MPLMRRHVGGTGQVLPTCVPARPVAEEALGVAGQELQFLDEICGRRCTAAHHLLLLELPSDHVCSASPGVVLVLAGWGVMVQ